MSMTALVEQESDEVARIEPHVILCNSRNNSYINNKHCMPATAPANEIKSHTLPLGKEPCSSLQLPSSTHRPSPSSSPSLVPIRRCLMYNELPISIKVKLIRDYETQNFSQRCLARKYMVSRATVNQIIKHKDRYLTDFAKMQSMAAGSAGGLRGNSNCMTLKRFRKTSVTNVNHVLEQYVAASRINKMTLSGPKLKQKAREVALEMGLSNFKASNGWLDSFKKRCSLEFNSTRLTPAFDRQRRQQNDSSCLKCSHEHQNDIRTSDRSLMPSLMDGQPSDDQIDGGPFNLMIEELHSDGDKAQHNQQTTSSSTSSPHSQMDFTADTTVPLDLHFSDSILVTGTDAVSESTAGHLQVDDYAVDNQPGLGSNPCADDNCRNQSSWVMGFDSSDLTRTTAPSPDSNHQQQQPHSMSHSDPLSHLRPQNQFRHHQARLLQHSHTDVAVSEDRPQLPENPLDSLPHTLSLPSDQMIRVELSGHIGDSSSLTAVSGSLHQKSESQSSSSQVNSHSTGGVLIDSSLNQDSGKHCCLLLTVNTSSSNSTSTACEAARTSPSSLSCPRSDPASHIEVPAIADVRSAIDTLERFALTKMPSLLSSILNIRQEVGNFVIQNQMLQEQFNHHQHHLQQQHSQNHPLNQ